MYDQYRPDDTIFQDNCCTKKNLQTVYPGEKNLCQNSETVSATACMG